MEPGDPALSSTHHRTLGKSPYASVPARRSPRTRYIVKQPGKPLSSGQIVTVLVNILGEKRQQGVKILLKGFLGERRDGQKVGGYQPLRERSGQSKQLGPAQGLPGRLSGEESTCQHGGDTGDVGSIPGSGRSLGKEVATNSGILAWGNPMDRGA